MNFSSQSSIGIQVESWGVVMHTLLVGLIFSLGRDGKRVHFPSMDRGEWQPLCVITPVHS